MKKDHRGFSLVEVIVVIAILGVLTGASVSLIGQMHYANMEKAAEKVSNMLERLRILSMSRKDAQYLYIYRLDDGYYMKLSETELNMYDDSVLGSDGTKICNNGIDIEMVDKNGTQTTLGKKSDIIRILFKRSGALNTDKGDNVSKIVFNGNGTRTIRLFSETGKNKVD